MASSVNLRLGKGLTRISAFLKLSPPVIAALAQRAIRGSRLRASSGVS